ncbi:sialate O-acetylesterase [Lentisphaera profundi]|uniref:Sialate O-acetylesterase n=1 Tax=Lentisphaera profundi TaxID=1658616 RepID=A0ABY7VU84_9BACT|nr:sialate O-acetylesterase [Lentisphaera profundi]WDE97776.1 sialate O-acetylesterase [Lentisphaera profundi]
MSIRTLFLGLLLFSFSTSLFSSEKTKIILFAGQSNCRGKGDFSKLTANDKAILAKAQKQITLALFEHGKKTLKPLDCFKAAPGDTKKYGPEWFFGPEMFMGMELSKQWPNQKFLFIKHAVGGSSLHAAWNINWSADIAKGTPDERRPRLYYTWIDYVKEVLATLDMSKYEIVGMVWVQGESDNPGMKKGPKYEYSQNYKKNLTTLINQVRSDLKQPQLPFFCLQIGKLPMTEIAGEMENVYALRHDGKKGEGKYVYPMYPQSHYNYEGMKKIGTNFGELYIEKCRDLID